MLIYKEEMRNQRMNKIILAFAYYRKDYAETFISEKLLYFLFCTYFALLCRRKFYYILRLLPCIRINAYI